MGNYFYSIGSIWQPFISLSDARKHMRFVLKNDKDTNALNRDNKGYYYIVRTDLRSMKTRRYPL